MMKTTFQAPVLCAMPLISSLCGAHEVRALKVTSLSTMLADDSIGEWGFAALIEADIYSLLLDTGNRPQTVLQNASELKLIGGVHLFRATDEQVDWTADKMSGFKVRYLIGAHCTGIEAVYRLR
jgi:metal-dependent hydrolase (beta-lactamase superfamily II)